MEKNPIRLQIISCLSRCSLISSCILLFPSRSFSDGCPTFVSIRSLADALMDILGLIRRLPEIVAYNKFDDDLFDRLNYSHTVAVLTVFAIIVTNRQFSENQIKCWVSTRDQQTSTMANTSRSRSLRNSLVVTNNMSIKYASSPIPTHSICMSHCLMTTTIVMSMN